MKTITFIFARAGSKNLPDKNLRMLGRKPLIAHAIELALSNKRFGRVIVSTDSNEIASLSLRYGAEVPFLRPAELSQDDSPEWLAWRHALRFVELSTGSLPEEMIVLPPTSPLRQNIDIQKCLNEFENFSPDMVVTITDSNRNPYFNMVKKNLDGSVSLVNESSKKIYRRQDAPIVFDLTTVCYVAKPEFVLKHNSIFQGNIRAVHIPPERAIDIDNSFDLQIAKILYQRQRSKK